MRNHHHRLPWHECGPESAGNGALMRIAPVVLPWLSRPSPTLWADALLCGMVTHNDALSNSACVAFTHIFWELLHAERTSEASWWLEQWMAMAPGIEGVHASSPEDFTDDTIWRTPRPMMSTGCLVPAAVRGRPHHAIHTKSRTIECEPMRRDTLRSLR